MSLPFQVATAEARRPVFAGAGTEAVMRLLERMAELGRLPVQADFLQLPRERERVLAELERLQEILRPGEVEPFARELRRFRGREGTPAKLASLTAEVWPLAQRLLSRAPSLLGRLQLTRFDEPVVERTVEGPPALPTYFLRGPSADESDGLAYFVRPPFWADWEARYPPYPDDRTVMTQIFDGPAFREYLWRIGINPAQVTEIRVDNSGLLDRGGTKTCYRLTITTSRGEARRIAMRLIPSHLDRFLPELEGEAMVTRALSQSAVAHLIPKFHGSARIRVSDEPPFTYLAFFNEWIDAPALLDLLFGNREEARSLVLGVLQTFADAVRRVPLFINADVAPIDIKVIRRRRGPPRFIFFDFGGSRIDDYTYAKGIYREYATPLSVVGRPIVPPDEILPVIQGIPAFRHALDQRLGFFQRGQLLQPVMAHWSAQDEAVEIEMLGHLWRLTDPTGYAARGK